MDFWTGQLSYTLVIHSPAENPLSLSKLVDFWGRSAFLHSCYPLPSGESFISERASGLLDRSAFLHSFSWQWHSPANHSSLSEPVDFWTGQLSYTLVIYFQQWHSPANHSSLSEPVDFWTGQLSYSLVIHSLAVGLGGNHSSLSKLVDFWTGQLYLPSCNLLPGSGICRWIIHLWAS